jgi:hypothetical protein
LATSKTCSIMEELLHNNNNIIIIITMFASLYMLTVDRLRIAIS